MARYLLLTIAFLAAGFAGFAQTTLSGKVVDADSGEPLIGAYISLNRNGVLVTGSTTDFDGFYSITELDPGSYDVEFSYTGYQSQKIEAVVISSGRANKLDSKMAAGLQLEEVVVRYERPLVEQDNTTQGKALTSEEIRNLPTRSVNALASLAAGVSSSDEGSDLNIRGSRSDGTNYYLDGIRVSGRMIPKQDIEELQVVTGGIEARYGDVTGGIVSATSKGPSDRFSGGVELETSQLFDNYEHNLASLSLSGPILKSKGETVLGYRLSGQYQGNKDDDPPALSVYRVKDDVLQQLEANPIIRVGSALYPAAQFVDNTGVEVLDYNPYEDRKSYDFTAKLDASIGKAVDVTFSGTYYRVENQFTPGGWRVFNSHNNPTSYDQRYRANVRLRHRLGGNTATPDGAQKGSFIQNAAYVLQFGYEKSNYTEQDPRHKDNLFDYGYIGNFDLTWEPAVPLTSSVVNDTLYIVPAHVDYTRIFNGYTPGDKNPVLTKYILNGNDNDNFNDFDVVNGQLPSNLSNVWSNHHTNVGPVYNVDRKRNSDIYTFSATSSFELVPGGSGENRHSIQFGILYEQRTNRGYDVFPFGLWGVARGYANEHLDGQGLDSSIVLSVLDTITFGLDLFTGDTFSIPTQVPIFAPNTQVTSTDNQFFKRLREKLGLPLNQYVNVDGLSPDQLTLDLFSARELNDNGFLSYWGYDYLGNQIDGITFEDFFTTRDANGIRTFPVAADRPNYQAAYVQDKFKFRDVIFRVGVRVDRFDANTKVLRDPYSLYDIATASDFHAVNPDATPRPGNIGDDFKVYVSSEGGNNVQAYRNGDTWYHPNGTVANDGTEIFGGGLVYPSYSEPNASRRDVTSPDFDPDISFEDYEPQINWMPRLAFSFPISDEANFFAHYDVLVQRPPSNTFVSPLTYFYWETNGSGLRNNANLKPERTVDYEVGFQQRIGNSASLKLSAYYKELRDMIQSRYILHVPAPVNLYETFDNLDFATVKGFSVAYEMRRTGNTSLNLAYTLQFADGTGSNSTSSRGIGSRGIQRTLFPMSYDERHRINAVLDYRYASGKQYNGPRIGGVDILANTGANLTMVAVSGRPYTAAIQPEAFGSTGISGAINGSRLPWNFTMGLQIDKSFNLTKPGATRGFGLNVFFRVSNLLDRRNIIGVYSYTGASDDDGFLNSERGLGFLQGINPELSTEAFLASYQWRMLNPDLYSLPRRMFLGATFDF